MPRSCALMDAKSGKSFFVTGMSSGNDRQVEVESSGDLGQKKSHAYSNPAIQVMNTYDPNSPNAWVMCVDGCPSQASPSLSLAWVSELIDKSRWKAVAI